MVNYLIVYQKVGVRILICIAEGKRALVAWITSVAWCRAFRHALSGGIAQEEPSKEALEGDTALSLLFPPFPPSPPFPSFLLSLLSSFPSFLSFSLLFCKGYILMGSPRQLAVAKSILGIMKTSFKRNRPLDSDREVVVYSW